MIKNDTLIQNYGENAKKVLEIYKFLSEHYSDKEKLKESEQMLEIMLNLKLDYNSLCAGIIFPFAKDDINVLKDFDEKLEFSFLLNQLMKCEELSKKYEDADGLKNMLIAIAKDIRAIIIKVVQMLVFARNNVKNLKDEKTISDFNSIDDIFIPISARLGLSEIKSELQDLSFKFHKPEEYKKLVSELKKETQTNSSLIDEMVLKIQKLISDAGIDGKVYGRIKHISSIYNKLQSKNYTLKDIYDIFAVRILVENISECYQALGLVHSNFTPLNDRFKDYIANPKPNGYKSLHTTIVYNNEFFEVQIRTHKMHEFAEYGIAAHFLYKENKCALNDLDNRLLWIRKLLENKEEISSEQLLQELKTDVYLGEIFVQTPNGKIIKLLENSNAIDFAYAIHSDVGNKCVGAKINGVMVPLTAPLSNGDVVEILTAQNSKGPSRDWLKYVQMQSTKNKINTFFKKQMRDENIILGKSMIEQYAKLNDENLHQLWKEEWLNKILEKNSFVNVDELYASVGYGSMSAEKVIKRLISLKKIEEKKTHTILDEITRLPENKNDKSSILGVQGSLTQFCKCCNPLPGDEIIGFVSRGRGIIIHKKDCETLINLPQSRFIEVEWNSKMENPTFSTTLELVTKNSQSIYVDITNVFSELNIKISSLNSSVNKNGELVLKMGVFVSDVKQLQLIKNKLNSLPNVYEIK